MLKRTDTHRPSAINVTEYEYVAFEYIKIGSFGGDILGDCMFLQGERETIRRHMASTGGTYSRHEHGGNCHICGASAVYTVLFYHALTNTYIRTGQDCAEKLEFAVDGDYNMFRNSVKAALEMHAGKRKAEAILEKESMPEAWTIYTATFGRKDQITKQYFENAEEERTVIDMVGNLVKFGSFVSDKQVNYLRILLDRINRREEIAAARKAQHDAAADLPVPVGRSTIEGVVLTLKHQESYYGPVTKMLVAHDDGWKVWGTRPSNPEIKKGDRIRFNAALTASKDDSKFGFFSRPTKTEILTVAVVA